MSFLLSKLKKLIPSSSKKIIRKILEKIKIILRSRTVIKKIDGIIYKLDLREFIDYEIYKNGCFEPETTKAIELLSKPGFTIIDIGANSGCHTLRFAKIVGPNGKVFAFEPMSWAFKKLKENVSLNKFKNIILEQKALSNKKENNVSVNFSCSWPINTNSKKLHPIHKGKIMEDKSDFITLDEYLEKNKVGKINLIKLDVDGFELKILKGTLKTIKTSHPIIILEIGRYTLKEQGDYPEDLVDLLLKENYQVCNESNLKPFSNRSALINSIPDKKTINVIALPLNLK
ncbi:MAG: hypothetical protein A2430_01915 [Candidatus Liptonbacteria bacterium RIFOXYC1_FULL_36_8]|uniref:Methyltransferase FkbM domain-containing protein n=3 Tax=Candidatus Liptoniibacteriota TaxID=1817909 RepID=A0A1G2CP19_9BACT|nr:MAG: hypothetical protein A2390_02600 [Candidatus Liptonbacteria bacterium RIFOXYB1_FULL_36_10]OGZ03458.1 MAG: hypothetical protein A2604_00595 [Candidatus Liptonbacteria bacterium RIFOXYD1_FULL_36_11]OGZ03487.1 MAG: hypothetical protein A2430_01915 [Candidatus Liptonbacteria bacterium RIFOXYC1_FULL_36_8]